MSIKALGQSHCGGLAWGVDPQGNTVITKAEPEITVETSWLESIAADDGAGKVFTVIGKVGGWWGESFLRADTGTGRSYVWRFSGSQLALRFPHDTESF